MAGLTSADVDSRLGWACSERVEAEAGEAGTWSVTYTVGESGIAVNGGIRVQLPDSWHVGEANTAKPLQADRPEMRNFVSGSCSRQQAGLTVAVEGGSTMPNKGNRVGIDGRSGRYVYVVRAVVGREGLRCGDTIEVRYGDEAGEGGGFEASRWADGPEDVLVAVDHRGNGHFTPLHDASPQVAVRNSAVSEVILTCPSMLSVGEEGSLHVAVLDRFGNRCEDFEGYVRIRESPGLEVADQIRLTRQDRGTKRIPFFIRNTGIVRVKGIAPTGLEFMGNPIACTQARQGMRIAWGDLHSHASRSFDGVGRSPFEYAREVSALDVYALTDHSEGWPAGTWEWLRDEVDSYYRPGHFVTLLAYEASFGPPWGHHNVYFPSTEGVVSGADNGTLLDLYRALTELEAVVIPHHTGVCWEGTEGNVASGATPNPDWKYHDERLRRLIEIYSGHGQSEYFDPSHPLSYEKAAFDLAKSNPGPYYAWDAWMQGCRLGVVASSDNHQAQPGRGELGLTAFWVSELSRGEVYAALRRRSTYATTGSRILLDFSLNGTRMGGIAQGGRSVTGKIRAHGTGLIDAVELVAGDLDGGAIAVRKRWTPGDMDFETEWEDGAHVARGIYYVRLRQREPYRGRVPMAWSGPIWTVRGLGEGERR